MGSDASCGRLRGGTTAGALFLQSQPEQRSLLLRVPRAVRRGEAVKITERGVDDVYSRSVRHTADARHFGRRGNPEVREEFALGFFRRSDHARAPLIDVPQLVPDL